MSDSSFFSNSVDWMKTNGITAGCNSPANTEYCPDDNVTRGEMAVFMKRLAEKKVVDAATADDSAKLGGLSSDAYQSRSGAVAIAAAFVQEPTSIAVMTGFTVPASGGAIIASIDVLLRQQSGLQRGLIWIEINGTGLCDGPFPAFFALFNTTMPPFDSVSTSLTAAANAGDHRIDVCASGFGIESTLASGSVTVQWVEKSEGGTTTGINSGKSLAEGLAELKAAFGDPFDN